MCRILQMLENVRGPVTDQVLSNTCGKIKVTYIYEGNSNIKKFLLKRVLQT